MEIREVQKKTQEYLKKRGVLDYKLDTDLIISHALEVPRLELYLKQKTIIASGKLDEIRNFVKRRGKREPMQYILGEVLFYDCRIKVDPRCLIPRPETEILVEESLKYLREGDRVLDLGTGSGAIALSLAKSKAGLQILAVDIEDDCLALARENAKELMLEKEVAFLKSDWFDSFSKVEKFNLIISNPPYLSEDDFLSAEKEIVNYEPKSALVSPTNGLSALKKIMKGAAPHLESSGVLALETGAGQSDELTSYANKIGYQEIAIKNDLNKIKRFLFLRIN